MPAKKSNRGGARPNAGGARVGAGRKPVLDGPSSPTPWRTRDAVIAAIAAEAEERSELPAQTADRYLRRALKKR